MKTKAVRIPIYRGRLITVVSNDINEVARLTKCDIDSELDEVYAHAIYGDYEGYRGYYVALNFEHRTKVTHGTIAHEASHITMMLMRDCGLLPDFENQEPFAYLLEWVTDEIYKALKSFGIKL